MQAFFQKFPMEFNDQTAIKMIHKKIESAQEKCKEKDKNYIEDLAIAHSMLETFFEEKGLDPASY